MREMEYAPVILLVTVVNKLQLKMMSIHFPLINSLHTSTANFAIKNLSFNSKIKHMFAKGIGVSFPG